MSDVENEIEKLQETESPPSIKQFLDKRLDDVIDYIQLTSYKDGQKTRKLGVLEYIKGILGKKSVVSRLCTEKYAFGLWNIRRNSHVKKVPDGIVFVCYEIYTETVKILLDIMPSQFLSIISKHISLCYIEQLVKSSECNLIVEMLPCFFSLTGNNFDKWINLLVAKGIVSIVFKHYNRPSKLQKDTQNLTKILYLFVSFTGNLFRDSDNMKSIPGIHYAFFYREIEKRTHTLLDTVFLGSDFVNRVSALELIREIVRVTEFLPSNESSFFSFFCRYLANSIVLKDLQDSVHTPDATVRIIHLINTLSITIRFKSVHILDFLNSSSLLGHIAMYLHSTATHTVTNEICYLLNELIYVDKVFYIGPIILFCQEIKKHSLQRAVHMFSISQKKHNPHVSISDCITPVVYILYKLYYMCKHESTNRNREARTQSKRFTVIDEGLDSYKILQQLEFLQEEHMHWYMTTRAIDHERRVSLEYCWSLPERPPNAEQFARYFCEYSASILPVYPPWLFH